MAGSKGIHDGHRERMWKRFQENGTEGFQDHELLEMLLFFVIRRGNTNETAHRLLKEFSSLQGVMKASPEALRAVDGVGEKTAEFLDFLTQYFGRIERNEVERLSLKLFQDRVRYFSARLSNCKEENVSVACLDSSMRVIRCNELIKGAFNHVVIDPAVIIRYVVSSPCHAAIMAHNHPEGMIQPSYDDIEVTMDIASKLKNVSIPLIDHVVVAGKRGCTLAQIGAYQPSDFFK